MTDKKICQMRTTPAERLMLNAFRSLKMDPEHVIQTIAENMAEIEENDSVPVPSRRLAKKVRSVLERVFL